MRVVIVGCGKVGGYLARELRRAGHPVIAIDKIRERALAVTEETGALAVVGDGTDLSLLKEVELRPSDFLLAVTGVDEENLVACQLARVAFGTGQVLARLNDPRNRPTFDALAIPVVAVTDLMVQVISHEVDVSDLGRVALIGRGEVSVVEVELPDDFVPLTTRNLSLPPSTVLVAIERPGEVVVPGADTELRPEDRVLAVTLVHLEDEARDAILTPASYHGHGDSAPAANGPLSIEDGTE